MKVKSATEGISSTTPTSTSSPSKNRLSPTKRTISQLVQETLAANETATRQATDQALRAAQTKKEMQTLQVQLQSTTSKLKETQTESATKEVVIQSLQQTAAVATVRATHATEGQHTAEIRLETSAAIVDEAAKKQAAAETMIRSAHGEMLEECFRNGIENATYEGIFNNDYVRHLPGRRQIEVIGTGLVIGLAGASQAKDWKGSFVVFGMVMSVAGVSLYLSDPDQRVIRSIKKAQELCKRHRISWQPSANKPKEGAAFFKLMKEKYGPNWYSGLYTPSVNKQIMQLLADEVSETTVDMHTDTADTPRTPTSPPKTATIPAQRPNLTPLPPVPNLPSPTLHQLLPPALPTERLPLPSVITQSTGAPPK